MSLNPLVLIDAIAVLLAQAGQLARVRLASAASPILRLMMERDHATHEAELLQRELAVLRNQRAAMKPHHRPDYTPDQRLEILQIMRLRGWSVVTVAERFILHPNTVRA